MGIGGSARNDGVNFMSDNFTVTFTMGTDGAYAIKTSKNVLKSSRFSDAVCKIPIIKSLYKLFTVDRLFTISIMTHILLDVLYIKSNNSSDPSSWLRIALAIVLAITLGCMIYVFKRVLYRIKLTWSFHGAEHKTIYALENNIDLTLENVRKCPRVARRCGTNLVVFFLPMHFLLSFFVPYASLRLILAFMLAYEIFDIDNGYDLPIVKLFYKLGSFCQQRLFTSEPTDEQLEAAIATIQKLQELEGQIDSV